MRQFLRERAMRGTARGGKGGEVNTDGRREKSTQKREKKIPLNDDFIFSECFSALKDNSA